MEERKSIANKNSGLSDTIKVVEEVKINSSKDPLSIVDVPVPDEETPNSVTDLPATVTEIPSGVFTE